MADTLALIEPTTEVATPTPILSAHDGKVFATSQQLADHFGKRHGDVIRAIRRLGCSPDFYERNFAFIQNATDLGKGRVRQDPAYLVSRDGFVFLAMGFTGKEAARWKEAYIEAFNAMEAKLREHYIEPLMDQKQFRDGIPLKFKLVLQEQGRMLMGKLLAEPARSARLNLYWQLLQVNDALGIPTEAMATLVGEAAPALEGGAA